MEIRTKIIAKGVNEKLSRDFLKVSIINIVSFLFLFYWRRLIDARDKNICQQLTKRALIDFECIYYKNR